MLRQFVLFAALGVALAVPAHAQSRDVLGYGRLVNNDLIGDRKDRWQTGNVASSRVTGFGWSGDLPDAPFDILEYRFNGGIISPENIATPADGDRPFAGYISLGVHTHFQKKGFEYALGGDLVFTGPQTGMDDLQTALHDGMDFYILSDEARDAQIENGVHPALVGEVATSIGVGENLVLRPFAEAQLGLETLARIGADVTLGPAGRGELLVRDRITGHRYRSVLNDQQGFSFVLGGDIAYVEDSTFLPDGAGLDLTDSRSRIRAGVHWQGENTGLFYGLTYHSEEFEGQSEGQIVGSIRLNLDF